MNSAVESILFTGVMSKDIAPFFSRELEETGWELRLEKNWKKAVRQFEDGNDGVIIIDQAEEGVDIEAIAKGIAKLPNSPRLVVIQEGSLSADPELLHIEAIDLLFSRSQSAKHIIKRILSLVGLQEMKPLEGRARVLRDSICQTVSEWPVIGDYFEVHEGITMQNPRKQLSLKRNDDLEVPFLKNGQVHSFGISGNSYFWNPEMDMVLSAPPLNILKKKEKLLLHTQAPPLKAAIEREGSYFGRSYYAIEPKNNPFYRLEDVCGLLNSRIFDFYIHNIFQPQQADGRDSSFIRALDVRGFPLPPALLEDDQSRFQSEVLELEMLSSTGTHNQRFSELTAAINAVVFEWFELSSEEVDNLTRIHF